MGESVVGCWYCDVAVSGALPLDIVASDESVLAFHHTRPCYPSHVVVIPRRHVSSLLDLEDDGLLAALFAVIRPIAARTVESEGKCRVVTNLGAYQDARHLHWHVIAGAYHDPPAEHTRLLGS